MNDVDRKFTGETIDVTAAVKGEPVSDSTPPRPSSEVEEAVVAPAYVVSATLISPAGDVIGRLERYWRGGPTIGDLCSMLITNSQERPDLDACNIDLRWRRV
jgi:hypothetical protein